MLFSSTLSLSDHWFENRAVIQSSSQTIVCTVRSSISNPNFLFIYARFSNYSGFFFQVLTFKNSTGKQSGLWSWQLNHCGKRLVRTLSENLSTRQIERSWKIANENNDQYETFMIVNMGDSVKYHISTKTFDFHKQK